MKKFLTIIICTLSLFVLVACGNTACQHRDADDNSHCDKCGNSYTDGRDVESCTHRDSDDNSLCDKCGDSYSDGKDLPDKHIHDYTEKNTDSKYLYKEADCENAATYFYSCSCGDKCTSTFTSGSANGHSYTQKNVSEKYFRADATSTEGKSYYLSCFCGSKSDDYFVIDATVEFYIDGSYRGYATTSHENGYKVDFSIHNQKFGISSSSTDYFYGWFLDSECQTPLTNDYLFTKDTNIYGKWIKTSSFYYTVSEGKATITGVKDKNNTTVVIPSYINTFPVERIEEYTFKDNTMLRKVVICDGVTSIGARAFQDCNSLTSVTIPDSVTSIEYFAFYGCSSLTSVTIPDSVTRIGSSAFYGCTSLTSVTIGNGVTSISCFYGCTSLTSITIPDSVTSIDGGAFRDCTSLTSVTIGNSVTSIGERAFENCYKLVEVINKSALNIEAGSPNNGYVGCYANEVHNGESKIVNKNNYLFYTYGGINYLLGYIGTDTAITLPENYEGKNYQIYNYAFYQCTNLTSVTIPDSVTSIGHGAFYECTSLTSVTIPDSVTIIGSYAFSGCKSLTSVTIGNGVTSIGDCAFRDCTSLTSIKYRGTESQWNAISKGSWWISDTVNYTITYNYKGK